MAGLRTVLKKVWYCLRWFGHFELGTPARPPRREIMRVRMETKTQLRPASIYLSIKALAGERLSRPPAYGGTGPAYLLVAAGLVFFPIRSPAQSPATFESLKADASAARTQGDLPRAIQLYSQAEQLNPQWPDGWWFLGTMLYGSDQYAPARDALSHYIDLAPNAGPALALRGLCEFELAQYPESLEDLQRGIGLGAANQPRNAQIVLYHEALVLTLLGKFEEAAGKYSVLAKQGAASADLITAIGLTGLRVSVLPKDADPRQAELISMVGEAAVALMNKDLPGAEQQFQEIFRRYPKAQNVHYFYGYLLFPLDPDQAIAQFQQEITVSPGSATAHAMLAWAFGLQGDFVAALPNARKAAEEDPALPMGQLVYGRALVETGEVNAGLPHLEEVLRAEPQNLEAHLTLAKAYSKLGRKEDASRERELCLAMTEQETANPNPGSSSGPKQAGAPRASQ